MIFFFILHFIKSTEPPTNSESNTSVINQDNNNTDVGNILLNKTLELFKNTNQTKFNMSKYVNLSQIFHEFGLNITDIKNRKKNQTKIKNPIPNQNNSSSTRKMPLWVIPLARGFQI